MILNGYVQNGGATTHTLLSSFVFRFRSFGCRQAQNTYTEFDIHSSYHSSNSILFPYKQCIADILACRQPQSFDTSSYHCFSHNSFHTVHMYGKLNIAVSEPSQSDWDTDWHVWHACFFSLTKNQHLHVLIGHTAF